MEVITKRSEVEAAEEPLLRRPAIFDRPTTLTFYEKAERVADCLTEAVLNDVIELDTKNNAVHAYVDAHYVQPLVETREQPLPEISEPSYPVSEA